jgi:anti-anti-sigma factor
VPLLTIALVPGPDQVVVRLTGEGDLSTLPVLSEALVQAALLGTRRVVVDVAAVRFWDSSSLRVLASVTAELAASGRSCRLVGATSAMRRLIRAAAFSDALEVDGPAVTASGNRARIAAGDARRAA